MNKTTMYLIASNVIMLLLLMGFAISWKFLFIFVMSIIGLTILAIPTGMLAFLWKKYKQLRRSYQTVFTFLLTIQQQLKQIDQMQITDLRIVNLKQKIKRIRRFVNDQKKE